MSMSYQTLYKSTEYKSWEMMKQRCNNPKAKQYEDYGGRGIKINKEWLSFSGFIKDMGRKPSPEYTLERINNNSDYTPSNCRWATRSEQMFNQRIRKDNTTGIRGVCFVKRINRWRAEIQFQGMRSTFGSFDTIEEAGHTYQQVLQQLQDNT